MTLTFCTETQKYVWLCTADDQVLSPLFETQELAVEWYGIISAVILEEYGILPLHHETNS